MNRILNYSDGMVDFLIHPDGEAVCVWCRFRTGVSKNSMKIMDHLKLCHSDCVEFMVENKKLTGNSSENKTAVLLPKGKINGTPRKDLDKLLLKMVIDDLHPLSMLEHENFIKYSKILSKSYKPPTKQKFIQEIIPAIYKEKLEEFKNKLNTKKSSSLSIDYWRNDLGRKFITISHHTVEDNKTVSRVMCTKDITACTSEPYSLGEIIREILHQWRISTYRLSIVAIEYDFMRDAFRRLENETHVPCVANIIDMTIGRALFEDPDSMKLLKKVRHMVYSFRYDEECVFSSRLSHKRLNLEYKQQKKFSVWTTVPKMLKRLLESREPLDNAILDLNTQYDIRKFNFYDISPLEWKVLEDFFYVLDPIERIISKLMIEQYPPLSIALSLLNDILNVLNITIPQTQWGLRLKNKISNTLKDNFEFLEENTIIGKATYLDPRYKDTVFKNKERVKKIEDDILSELIERIEKGDVCFIDSNPDDSFNSNSSTYEPEQEDLVDIMNRENITRTVKKLLKEYAEVDIQDKKQNPLQFWSSYDTSKEFRQLAETYLSIPMTSIPIQLIFTNDGTKYLSSRSKLSSNLMNEILFLRSHL